MARIENGHRGLIPEREGPDVEAMTRVVETGDPAIRVPPHSIEAEQAVLGAVMLDPGTWPAVSHLAASDFYRSDHRAIYAAIAEMFEDGTPVDVVTVAVRLDDNPEVGGLEALQLLTDDTADPANAGAYAAELLDRAKLRALIKVGVETGVSAFSGGASAADVEADLRAKLDALPVTKGGGGIELLDGAAIEAAEWGDPEYVIEGLLPSPGLSILGASIKLGKTTLATQLGLAVASGDEFLGRRVRQGRVVYLLLEDEAGNPAMVRERLRAMGWRPGDDFFLGLDCVGETEPGEFIRALIDQHAPALVIVDMLAGLVRPSEGNDYQDVRAAMKPVRAALAGTRAHVLMVHHHRKASGEHGDGLAGSTAWGGAVDTVIELYRDKDGVGRVVATTQRYGKPIEPTALRFDETTRESILASRPQHLEKDARVDQAVIDWLGEQRPEPQTLTAIRSAVEGGNGPIGESVRRLVREGMVLAVGTGDRPKYTVRDGPGFVQGTVPSCT